MEVVRESLEIPALTGPVLSPQVVQEDIDDTVRRGESDASSMVTVAIEECNHHVELAGTVDDVESCHTAPPEKNCL